LSLLNRYWTISQVDAAQQRSNTSYEYTFIEDCTDQITRFIAQHHCQAGIQHLGFSCINNIKETVRLTRTRGAQFLTPLAEYYFQVGRTYVCRLSIERLLTSRKTMDQSLNKPEKMHVN
jgi:4-hydroxyphenylpyruvate dioxygenase-like putative hemolysin